MSKGTFLKETAVQQKPPCTSSLLTQRTLRTQLRSRHPWLLKNSMKCCILDWDRKITCSVLWEHDCFADWWDLFVFGEGLAIEVDTSLAWGGAEAGRDYITFVWECGGFFLRVIRRILVYCQEILQTKPYVSFDTTYGLTNCKHQFDWSCEKGSSTVFLSAALAGESKFDVQWKEDRESQISLTGWAWVGPQRIALGSISSIVRMEESCPLDIVYLQSDDIPENGTLPLLCRQNSIPIKTLQSAGQVLSCEVDHVELLCGMVGGVEHQWQSSIL